MCAAMASDSNLGFELCIEGSPEFDSLGCILLVNRRDLREFGKSGLLEHLTWDCLPTKV